MTKIEDPYLSLFEMFEHGLCFVGANNEPCFLVSDTFAYACADAESFELERAPEFLKLFKKYGWDGIKAYVSLQRQIDPVKELMNAKFEIIREEIKNSGMTITPSEEE